MSKPKSSASLFIVDDDGGLLQLAERALRREGYAVDTAGTAAAAISWLQSHSPALLLLDLQLPDARAPQLIGKLNGLGCLPPFLIITGQGDEGVAVEMMKSGALDYLVKNKDFLDFLPAVVRRALRQADQQKKLAAAEQALHLSEERFRVALKNSPIMVFNQDTDLHYTWVYNAAAGLAEKDFLGKTDEEIFPADEADRLMQIKLRVLATGAGVRQEVTCTFKGVQRFYDLTVEAVGDENGQIAGITGAALEITERKRLEQEVLQISELEQRRIGQDLHDGICQQLAGIELKSQVLEQALKKKSSAQTALAGQIARHVRDAITQTRSLARSLSPFILESEGLTSALRDLAVNTEKLFNVACHFEHQTPSMAANTTVATHLYRIAQEAVTNAVRHGKASRIDISLSTDAGQTLLTIKDNGTGFTSHPGAAPGMGLRIMQYRAGIIGANLLIQRPSGGGVAVVCFLNARAV